MGYWRRGEDEPGVKAIPAVASMMTLHLLLSIGRAWFGRTDGRAFLALSAVEYDGFRTVL